MLAAAIELAKKDLRIYFRDPVAWLLGFMLPILMVTIFGFLMGAAWGGSGPAPRVDLYVVDEDDSERSRDFVEALRSSDMLRVRPRPGESPLSRERAQQYVVDGEASHALVIGAGFGQNEGSTPTGKTLSLMRDPGRGMEDQIIRINLLQALFRSGGGNWWIGSLRDLFKDAGVPEDQLESFSAQAATLNNVISSFQIADEAEPSEDQATEPGNVAKEVDPGNEMADPMQFVSRMLPLETEDFSPPSRPKQATFQIAQSVAGMTVMMLMFGVTSCGRTLLLERERGTMVRLLSIGVPRTSLLAGTAMFTVIIGILQIVVMLAYGELMFRVGIFRDPITLVVLALLWVITASSFGMLIAAIAKSEKQADMLSTILIISMAALGGCWFPLQILDLPTPLEMITRSTATYWAMTGFQGMLWNGSGLLSSRLITAMAVQIGYTAVLSMAAVWFFNRNYVRA